MIKKGFSYVEILAVIVLLAVLVVLAVPAIFKSYYIAKKEAFVNDAQNLYNMAVKTYTDNYLKNNLEDKYTYCDIEGDSKNKLSSSTNKHYKIQFDENKVVHFIVYDNTYKIEIYRTLGNSGVVINEVNLDEIKNDFDKILSCN